MLPDYFRAIGSDRHLTLAEIEKEQHAPDDAWELYQQGFDGFCETALDPQFHRFDHPAVTTGSLRLGPEESVLVVGTGPSFEARVASLAPLRSHFRIFTSPRGAAALARHGLRPDLVLIEHRTALDAHHSTRNVLDGTPNHTRSATLVAAEWRTPSSLVAGVASDRLFVPESLPTWGFWPATLVAMAIAAGACHVGLLGIDLGDAERHDPAYAPGRRLLSLLAKHTSISTIDCGAGGAQKDRWLPGTVEDLAAARPMGAIARELRKAPSPKQRRATATAMLLYMGSAIDVAREALSLALRARSGTVDVAGLRSVAAQMLSWRDDEAVRIGVQETLGASFLPRLWRAGMDPAALGSAVWRPVLLASHEIVTQADRLSLVVRDLAA